MKSIQDVEKFIDECIIKADDCLPADSMYYYKAGLYTVLNFLSEDKQNDWYSKDKRNKGFNWLV